MTNNSTTPGCFKQIRSPEPNTFPYYVGNYVFPVVFAAGLTGNILNLLVLNRMKAKSVHFLSAIAMVDLCFFLVMFVLNLSVYDSLAVCSTFLSFYYKAKMTLVTLANWFSSASIWFIVVVSVERLIVIRTPLRARYMWHRNSTAAVITAVSLLTLCLQLPYFLWLKPSSRPDCNDSNRTAYVMEPINRSHLLYDPLKYAIVICPIIVVTIPLILLISLNSLLIYHVRLSRLNIKKSGGLLNHGHNNCLVTENEAKITYTVCVVVCTFFVFNFPSVIVFIYYFIEKDPDRLSDLITMSWITNYMVTLNKALTFPIYCCSSSNFRDHLTGLVTKVMNKITVRWRKLSLTDTVSSTTGGTSLHNGGVGAGGGAGGAGGAGGRTSRQYSNDSDMPNRIGLNSGYYSKRTSCNSESDRSTTAGNNEKNRDCLPLL